MFTSSKTHLQKSSHHATQPFFGKGSAIQPGALFFNQILTPSVIQKKCAGCEEEEGVQTKLTIGQPDDQYEREADAIADRVVSSSDTDIQRQPEENYEEEETLQAKPVVANTSITPLIMRERDGKVAAPSQVDHGIKQTRGGGQALAAPVCHSMEHAIGADFKDVRVHTNGEADALNRSLNARAFTTGQDIYFKSGEYQPGTQPGQKLLAHELTHVVQQSANKEMGKSIQRWGLGAAPAPAGWSVVTNPLHRQRLNLAETIVRGVLTSRRCQNYFSNGCGTANALQDAFDNSNVYLRPIDDNIFGVRSGGNIAFNLRAFRIGRFMMASTLLHEMFHTCDPTPRATQNLRELNSENAVETCRLHTPWIDTLSPTNGAAGTRLTIRGWGFGPTRSGVDAVQIGGVSANIISWAFMTDNSSRVEIIAEVPAGAGAGGVTVINNRVRSNNVLFTVV